MSRYSIPAMSLNNEFSDLNFVAKYVDQLVSTTGDSDYGVVFEWDDNGPVPGGPPVAFLTRRKGGWKRSVVSRYGPGTDDWELGNPEDVNDH
jgi:hypothetical protein